MELAVAGTFPLAPGLVSMGVYHAFIGIIEGGATAFALSLIVHARPDIVGGDKPENMHKAKDLVIGTGIVIALAIAILAPYYASTYPDGLDSTFLRLSGVKNPDTVHINDSEVAQWQAPFTDYMIPGMDKPGEVLAIISGIVVLFVIGFGITRFIARKH